jgi:hypothetical protein
MTTTARQARLLRRFAPLALLLAAAAPRPASAQAGSSAPPAAEAPAEAKAAATAPAPEPPREPEPPKEPAAAAAPSAVEAAAPLAAPTPGEPGKAPPVGESGPPSPGEPAPAAAVSGEPSPAEPASSSQAEDHAAAIEVIPTFSYRDPQPKEYRLRAVLELAGIELIGLIGYLASNPPPSIPGMPSTVWPWDKVIFRNGSWSFDDDDITTNYRGHPAAGTVYYLFARGNRLSVLESSLWTLVCSFLWEVVEYREMVSVNDMVMTPVGGIAIGEAFTQLSSYFDRSGNSTWNRVLAWLFAPPKKFHDWIDGAEVSQLADPGWHEFRLTLAGGLLHQQDTYPVVRLGLSTRIVRIGGYGAPGERTLSLRDAPRSEVDFHFTFSSRGTVDTRFRTRTDLVGLYHRHIRVEEDGRHGHDVFFGASVAYDYQSHDTNLEAGGLNDELIFVEIPGLNLSYRLFAGHFTLEADVGAALTFGGVRPYALTQPTVIQAGVAFPSVILVQDYYHSIGIGLGAAVRLRLGPMLAGASLAFNDCTAIHVLDPVEVIGTPVPLSDQRLETAAWASYVFPVPGIELSARWERRRRSGHIADVSRKTTEDAGLLALALIF